MINVRPLYFWYWSSLPSSVSKRSSTDQARSPIVVVLSLCSMHKEGGSVSSSRPSFLWMVGVFFPYLFLLFALEEEKRKVISLLVVLSFLSLFFFCFEQIWDRPGTASELQGQGMRVPPGTAGIGIAGIAGNRRSTAGMNCVERRIIDVTCRRTVDLLRSPEDRENDHLAGKRSPTEEERAGAQRAQHLYIVVFRSPRCHVRKVMFIQWRLRCSKQKKQVAIQGYSSDLCRNSGVENMHLGPKSLFVQISMILNLEQTEKLLCSVTTWRQPQTNHGVVTSFHVTAGRQWLFNSVGYWLDCKYPLVDLSGTHLTEKRLC